MTVAATNLFMSYTGVVWTSNAAGATPIPIDEVVDVDWDLDGEPVAWYADGNSFPSLVIVKKQKRNVKVMGGNIAKGLSIPRNTPGTLVAILNDALNGEGTGAITFTLNPCLVQGTPNSGSSGEFATGSITFLGYKNKDNVGGDPLSFAIAP